MNKSDLSLGKTIRNHVYW